GSGFPYAIRRVPGFLSGDDVNEIVRVGPIGDFRGAYPTRVFGEKKILDLEPVVARIRAYDFKEIQHNSLLQDTRPLLQPVKVRGRTGRDGSPDPAPHRWSKRAP